MFGKVEIKTDGAFANVYIDGKEVKGVTGYELEHNVDGMPTLKLELLNPYCTFVGNTVDCKIKKYTLWERIRRLWKKD